MNHASEEHKANAWRQITYLLVPRLPANLCMFSVEITFSWEVNVGDLYKIKSALNWVNLLVTLKASLCPALSAFLCMTLPAWLHLSITFSCSPLSQRQHFAPCFSVSYFCPPPPLSVTPVVSGRSQPRTCCCECVSAPSWVLQGQECLAGY